MKVYLEMSRTEETPIIEPLYGENIFLLIDDVDHAPETGYFDVTGEWKYAVTAGSFGLWNDCQYGFEPYNLNTLDWFME